MPRPVGEGVVGDEVHVVADDPVDVGRPEAGIVDGGAAGGQRQRQVAHARVLRERGAADARDGTPVAVARAGEVVVVIGPLRHRWVAG